MGNECDSMSCESSLKVAVLGNLCPWPLPPLIEKGVAKIYLVSLRVLVFHG